MFHQGIVTLICVKVTPEKIKELVQETCSYLASSDYHLFRRFQNHLQEIPFTNQKVLETDLAEFFTSKLKAFYIDGINVFINRWQGVIENQGMYIDNSILIEYNKLITYFLYSKTGQNICDGLLEGTNKDKWIKSITSTPVHNWYSFFDSKWIKGNQNLCRI